MARVNIDILGISELIRWTGRGEFNSGDNYIYDCGKESLSLGGSVVKNLPADAGDMGSIPGSGRSPGEGNCNPL